MGTNKSIAGFLAEHDSFGKLIDEYGEAWVVEEEHDRTMRAQDRAELLSELDAIAQGNSIGHMNLDAHMASQLGRLSNIDTSIASQESQVSQRNLERAKRRYQERQMVERTDIEMGGDSSHDVRENTIRTMGAIRDITDSRLPKFISRFVDYIELPSRRKKYDHIAETRGALDQAIMASLESLRQEKEQGDRGVDAQTLSQLDALQRKADSLDARRDEERKAYVQNLKSLLLDGLSEVCPDDGAYANAATDFSGYMASYVGDGPRSSNPWRRGLMLGVVNQSVRAGDDGTLDSFLSEALPDAYSDGSVHLPAVLSRHLSKPVCLTYFSEHVAGVYGLFSNYAIQLMALFTDETISIHLVDCANAGSNYAAFNSCADIDEDKRVDIVRTKEQLSSVLSDLHEYVIESNSLYLKDTYTDIEEYNRNSVMKREMQAVFVSALSELSNDDLETLTTIARTGCRCGVLVFVGVSSDEFQPSGVITRARAQATNALASLCDRLYMDSTGGLGFGNGLPPLTAPPAMGKMKIDTVLRDAVIGSGRSSILLLEDYLPSGDEVLSGSCRESLDIPVGQTPQGTEYAISFHKDSSYMLLGGNPSAGKSSLIHTMILQCITRYRPEDLEIYIADLKDGSEFDSYAMAGVKSVRAVLDDSENDLATSFLQFISNEIRRRLQSLAELKDATGHHIRNIEEFYEVNEQNNMPCKHIPRLLLIVDEFQSLYSNNRKTGELTNWILRMGRTVGVAVVFSSQRSQADLAASSNSFGSQTKEYFIYRAMMKLPYSGAKDIMSERCADTGRENPALRKAQTLKVGQVIVNSNMGATEEDSQIIQCYYPSSDLIDGVCAAVVEGQGRREDSYILGSDKPVRTSRPSSNRIVLGESNRFHADNGANDDAFFDDMLVSLDASAGSLGVYGISEHAFASAAQACMAALSYGGTDVVPFVCGEGSPALMVAKALGGIPLIGEPSGFVTSVKMVRDAGSKVLAVLIDPYRWESLRQSAIGRNGADVEEILKMIDDDRTFVLVCGTDIKRMKVHAAWHEDAVQMRVMSVGNPAILRQMVSSDVADKIHDGSFNIARADVIKAYYYNRATAKFGRLRMFPVEEVEASGQPLRDIPTALSVDGTLPPAGTRTVAGVTDNVPADNGWSGLVGN